MNKPHENKCECDVCSGKYTRGGARRQDDEMILKYGWCAHFITDAENMHTHGLDETEGHLDFQIVLPLPPKVGHSILATFAKRVQGGEQFEDGQEVTEIIHNYPVKLHRTQECERDVLRIILPDKFGSFVPELMERDYAKQWTAKP